MSGRQRIRALALATAAKGAKQLCTLNSSGDGMCAEIDDLLKRVSTYFTQFSNV